MIIEEYKFSYDELLGLLNHFSYNFNPPLCEVLDLQQYSDKVVRNADFLICRNGNIIIGVLAYYKNKDNAQLYVTMFCVDNFYQRCGIGQKMLAFLKTKFGNVYQSIALEVDVDNLKGYNFYIKQGFKKQEDRGNKYLMLMCK